MMKIIWKSRCFNPYVEMLKKELTKEELRELAEDLTGTSPWSKPLPSMVGPSGQEIGNGSFWNLKKPNLS